MTSHFGSRSLVAELLYKQGNFLRPREHTGPRRLWLPGQRRLLPPSASAGRTCLLPGTPSRTPPSCLAACMELCCFRLHPPCCAGLRPHPGGCPERSTSAPRRGDVSELPFKAKAVTALEGDLGSVDLKPLSPQGSKCQGRGRPWGRARRSQVLSLLVQKETWQG